MNPPPFLVSFATPEQYLKALPEDLRSTYADVINNLCSKGYPPVVSVRCLATLFGFSPKFCGALYRCTESYYRNFIIKKGKKQRVINAPKVALKVIQKWLGFYLGEVLSFDSYVFGFVKGRSTVDAAAVHCGARWIYSVDISDFFPSIKFDLVVEAFLSLGYPQHGAELAAKLCCFNGGLAQGSPASPILSNLAFGSADIALIQIASRHGIRYTRYADDIVFSGVAEFPQEVKSEIRIAIETRGWKIADLKVRYAEVPNRLKVHGLLVHSDKPRLTKGYRNKIRAYKYLINANKINAIDLPRLSGHISYAKSVE